MQHVDAHQGFVVLLHRSLFNNHLIALPSSHMCHAHSVSHAPCHAVPHVSHDAHWHGSGCVCVCSVLGHGWHGGTAWRGQRKQSTQTQTQSIANMAL
eukprot:1453254-Alexandrium_andersonii.AAC.1